LGLKRIKARLLIVQNSNRTEKALLLQRVFGVTENTLVDLVENTANAATSQFDKCKWNATSSFSG
jgi:hypothetical protein